MANDKWDDDHIENLLRDFPAIRDDRPKEEVYNRLKQKEPGKKQNRWLPLLVAALAFITVGVLVATIISQNGLDSASHQDSTAEDSAGSEEAATTSEGAGEMESSSDAAFEESEDMENFSSSSTRTAVYEEDLENFTLFTIGLTENATVIPISFLIPNEQVAMDFADAIPNSIQLYNRYAADIDEQALGFDEYHPYLGTIAESEEGAQHTLPADHQYDLASAAINVYLTSLQETFQDAVQVAIVDDQGNALEFDQVGTMDPVITGVEDTAFYAYTLAAGETYLVPAYGTQFVSAEEALEAMKKSPNDLQQSPVPSGVDFASVETEETVQIEFTEPLDFETLEPTEAMRLIDSLSLAAESFGKQIVFMNTVQQQWQGIDFSQPLPAPVSPNKMEWTAN